MLWTAAPQGYLLGFLRVHFLGFMFPATGASCSKRDTWQPSALQKEENQQDHPFWVSCWLSSFWAAECCNASLLGARHTSYNWNNKQCRRGMANCKFVCCCRSELRSATPSSATSGQFCWYAGRTCTWTAAVLPLQRLTQWLAAQCVNMPLQVAIVLYGTLIVIFNIWHGSATWCSTLSIPCSIAAWNVEHTNMYGRQTTCIAGVRACWHCMLLSLCRGKLPPLLKKRLPHTLDSFVRHVWSWPWGKLGGLGLTPNSMHDCKTCRRNCRNEKRERGLELQGPIFYRCIPTQVGW